MSAEIINLRRARKAKKRCEDQARAEENRARFGRPKHEREMARAEENLAVRRLDGLRRDRDPNEPGA